MHVPPQLSARFESIEPLTDTPLERTLRAHDTVLQRDVMIKLPATKVSSTWTAEAKDRLLREARALAKIRHEGIATVHWVEETPLGPLVVLDLPQGESLAERLEEGPLDPDETVALGCAVSEALVHVHRQGIVHRCIGPSTIRLLPDGSVQLSAFTFAKELSSHGGGSSLVHGARSVDDLAKYLPDYSAPEQVLGHGSDARSDIYALGCTLFRCLAGRDQHDPSSATEPAIDLLKLRKDVGKPLAEVVRKCSRPSNQARYQNAQQVVDALKELQTSELSNPRGGSAMRWLALVAALLVTTLVVREFWPGSPDPHSSPRDDGAGVEDRRYLESYGPEYARLHGLFIGIAQGYAGSKHSVLQNPTKEVEAVAKQLRANDPKWAAEGAIKILTDEAATFAAIETHLEQLVLSSGKEDGVVIYFAGHGVRDGRSFGLCAADVQGTVGNGTGYLRRDWLVTYLDRLKAKHVLVVLDCCHSGAVFDVGPSRGRDPERARDASPGQHHRRSFSREFLCSAAAGEKASDGTQLSPFCTLLLEQLRQPATKEKQYVAARFLSGRIAEAMDHRMSHSNHVQIARFRQMSEQDGSFVFRLARPK